MEALIYLSIAGLLVSANGLTVEETTGVLAGFEDVQSEWKLSHDEGKCKCSDWGCWCRGIDDGVPIHVYFSVDETRHRRCRHTIIDATIFIGKRSFIKLFEVDRFEDFCETVGDKRFCFRIDVKNTKHSRLLRGCLRVSRPHKVDMGCFELPLMTSEPDHITSEDLESADAIDSDSDISDIIYNTEEVAEPRPGRPVTEMEAPLQTGIVGRRHSRGHCSCCEHGCSCHAVDDGYRVIVILSVDESRHCSDRHAVIQGNFRVGRETFVKRFDADELESFCHEKFCFRIRARKLCSGGIRVCMRLNHPRRVNFGCFRIPLLATDSGADDDECDDLNAAERVFQ